MANENNKTKRAYGDLLNTKMQPNEIKTSLVSDKNTGSSAHFSRNHNSKLLPSGEYQYHRPSEAVWFCVDALAKVQAVTGITELSINPMAIVIDAINHRYKINTTTDDFNRSPDVGKSVTVASDDTIKNLQVAMQNFMVSENIEKTVMAETLKKAGVSQDKIQLIIPSLTVTPPPKPLTTIDSLLMAFKSLK